MASEVMQPATLRFQSSKAFYELDAEEFEDAIAADAAGNAGAKVAALTLIGDMLVSSLWFAARGSAAKIPAEFEFELRGSNLADQLPTIVSREMLVDKAFRWAKGRRFLPSDAFRCAACCRRWLLQHGTGQISLRIAHAVALLQLLLLRISRCG